MRLSSSVLVFAPFVLLACDAPDAGQLIFTPGGYSATGGASGGANVPLPQVPDSADAGSAHPSAQDGEAGPPDAALEAGPVAADAGADALAIPVTTNLADLPLDVRTNGYGPLEKNTSNGEDVAGDGNPITLNGVVYQKGLGVHAASEVHVALGGKYTTFVTDVGIDDEVGDSGSVVFQVSVDGVALFDSGTMTGATATKKARIDVTGKQELVLVVTDAGDGIVLDHADWAGARLIGP